MDRITEPEEGDHQAQDAAADEGMVDRSQDRPDPRRVRTRRPPGGSVSDLAGTSRCEVQERDEGIAAEVVVEGDEPATARHGKGGEVGVRPVSPA